MINLCAKSHFMYFRGKNNSKELKFLTILVCKICNLLLVLTCEDLQQAKLCVAHKSVSIAIQKQTATLISKHITK